MMRKIHHRITRRQILLKIIPGINQPLRHHIRIRLRTLRHRLPHPPAAPRHK